MGEINASATRINEIVGVIDGIAFQTNILALNAAVEAARAGDHGRGFAVVASEVRGLAQRSSTAAREIKTLISDSTQKVEAGSKLVDDAGRTMQEILDSVNKVSRLITDIADAGQSQSSGIDQVHQAIAQIDTMTQQNAALVEQVAAAAQSLKGQSGRLTESMSSFRVIA
jgi:methyl-accepting chemotaxis protein